MSNGSERTPERKLTSAGLEHRPQADFDIATNRPLGPEGQDNFDALRSRIAALEAVIREAQEFDGQQTVDGVTDQGYLSPEEWRSAQIDRILDLAPSSVLDQMIREAKAEAWDAGVVAGATWEFADAGAHAQGGTTVPRPANPYRNGDA